MSSQQVQDSLVSDIVKKDLIDLLGLNDLPEEKKEEYRKTAAETVYNRAFIRATDMLEEMGLLEEYQKEDRDEEGTKTFFKSHGIDLEQLLKDEALIYKTQMKMTADLLDAGIDVKAKAA